MSRKLVLATALVVLALVAAYLALGGAVGQAEEGPALRLEMTAFQEGTTIRYNITLVNTSTSRVGDIFIAGTIPSGATFGQATATPSGSWFRGLEGEAAVWLSDGVPANGRQGPFSYTATAPGAVGPAWAWVHWRSPSPGTAVSADVAPGKYVGSEACASCHAGKYNNFRVSGHPYKLRKAEEARFSPLPLPAGFTWDAISYVIGGFKWKARYIDRSGFIITSAAGKPGNNQYNLATGAWVNYEAGAVKKYDCGRCHTTGYSPAGNQDGLPGIVGTWAFPGVQCEACHGPAGQHVAEGGGKANIVVDEGAALCGQCHVRGDPAKIPASGGFIQHHEQYNEFLASPHKAASCVTCHSPHKRSEFSIDRDCTACHAKAKTDFAGSKMEKVGVSCTDCHMPMATKSAVAQGPFKGDVKTHLFSINTDPSAKMFTEDGKFAKDFVTLDFACLSCHRDQNLQWAGSYAKGAHTIGK